MGAGVVKLEQHGNRIHIHTGRNAHRMGSSNSIDQKCEECTTKFSPFKRQLLCKDCGRKFCSVCYVQTGKQCKKCQILLSGNFSRIQLKQWKPKDLKALLHRHDVNTSKCHEKDDLIDLIFSNFGSRTNYNTRDSEPEQNAGNFWNQRRQADQSEQESNVAGASQSGFTNSSTPTSQPENEPVYNFGTQSHQTENVTSNQSGTGAQSGEDNQSEMETSDLGEKNQNDNSRITLEEIKSEEHIEQLSIKCLKRLLLNNFVDYKGCCERWELQERVKRLWKHDQMNKQKAEEHRKISDDPSLATNSSSGADDELCKICMDAAIDCVLLECGHMVTCTQCGKRLSECPICRQFVVRAVHIFKA